MFFAYYSIDQTLSYIYACIKLHINLFIKIFILVTY